MTSKSMIALIVDVERNQHGIKQLYPSRISYFQRTNRYDDYTHSVQYDEYFDKFVKECEAALGGVIYRPTAKKILNNWYSWALEQRTALLKLRMNRILASL